MCGIAGVFHSGEGLDVSVLVDLGLRIAHRGPNDEGYFILDTQGAENVYAGTGSDLDSQSRLQLSQVPKRQAFRLGLVHRRLSVIDLTSFGHQPISDPSKNYWMVFNGEIYNYQSLKEELQSLGHSFLGHSDSEVLLASYIQWGESIHEHLNGMWAFVIYDKVKNILFGSRDRLGVKPLYYLNEDLCFAFCSEIKGLVEEPKLYKKKLNKKAVWEYLVWASIEDVGGMFWDGICELPPSSYFVKDLDSPTLKLCRYENPVYGENSKGGDHIKEDVYLAEIQTKIKDSVKLRLNSDVPVAVALSGGIDSSCLSAMACYHHHHQGSIAKVKAFTVSYPGFKHDETYHAEVMAQYLQLEWQKVYPTEEISRKLLEDIVYLQDLPFLSISLFAHYSLISEVSRQGVKVFVEGQGADELFGGYPQHIIAFLRECISGGRYAEFWKFLKNAHNSTFSRKYLLFSLVKSYLLENSEWAKRYLVWHHKEFETFNPKFKDKYKKISKYKAYETSNLHSSLQYDMYGHCLKFLLRATDRNSMAFGVECRPPFADDAPLVHYVNKIPSGLKLQHGFTKYLLRKCMESFLPAEIAWRKDKKGFTSPESIWLKQILSYSEYYLDDSIEEYFDIGSLRSMFQDYIKAPERFDDRRVWRIINFLVWKRVYKV